MMPNRANDRLLQAEHDLKHASHAREVGDHDWACFAAQQAAEKAVKALHQAHGQEAWGHSVLRLLEALPVPAPDPLIERARSLDAFYVPARYPNGHFTGPAFEYYGPLQSEQALSHAGDIVEFVRQALAGD
jgi:HEPN domain-containing protein